MKLLRISIIIIIFIIISMVSFTIGYKLGHIDGLKTGHLDFSLIKVTAYEEGYGDAREYFEKRMESFKKIILEAVE